MLSKEEVKKERSLKLKVEITNKPNWTDKVTAVFTLVMSIGTIGLLIVGIIGLNIGSKIKENLENISVDLLLPINLNFTADVYATRLKDKSFIKFDVPIEVIKDLMFNTTCYIENNEGGDSIYIIKELNLTTPRLKTNEEYKFNCRVENGVVSKILQENY